MHVLWIVWGVVGVAAAAGLAALVRTRWLQSHTLSKCVLLSVVLHAVLAAICALVGGIRPASWGANDEGRMSLTVALSTDPADDEVRAAPALRDVADTTPSTPVDETAAVEPAPVEPTPLPAPAPEENLPLLEVKVAAPEPAPRETAIADTDPLPTAADAGPAAAAAGTTLAAAAAAWLALDSGPAPPPAPDAPVLRLIQPAIPQDEKWHPDLIPGHLDRILRLTAGPPAADGSPAPAPALVVWPETAMPWSLDNSADLFRLATKASGGAPIAMGVGRAEAGLYRNSLALVDGTGRVLSVYDKHHLVPFGEYIPFGEWLGRFGIRGLAASDGAAFVPGPGPAVMTVPGIGPVMPLICYEGIFAEEVNAMPERAVLLVLVTNDAWFGLNVGPYQHLAQGRLRAIEQGLPMVRVANTGISALIDPHGRILGQIPLGHEGVLDLPLPAALPPTPYSRTGDWPVILLLIVSALALARGAPTRDEG